jgi:uncharacterized protein YbaP (TraB family)
MTRFLSCRSIVRRGLLPAILGATLILNMIAAQAQAAETSCPPQASPPTPQQMQEAGARAKDRGLLWRITKDGRSSHLYGTIHVGTLDWAFPGPKVRAALMDAEAVAFELDPLDPAIQTGLRSAGASAPARLPSAQAAQLGRLIERACLPEQALAAMHPMLQAMTVMLVEASRDGLQVAYGQELVLAGFSRSRKLRTVSLETPERQLAALIPKDAALAERYLASTLEQIDSGQGRRVLARLAAAWERGDLDEIADYERWCGCVKSTDDKTMMAALNDERNPDMADKIAALHGQGRRAFVAVGALHMTGPKALPELMRARGFQVERIEFR